MVASHLYPDEGQTLRMQVVLYLAHSRAELCHPPIRCRLVPGSLPRHGQGTLARGDNDGLPLNLQGCRHFRRLAVNPVRSDLRNTPS